MTIIRAFNIKSKIIPIGLLIIMAIMIFGCWADKSDVGFVDDQIGLLTKTEMQRITKLAKKIQDELAVHLMVVILKEKTPNLDNTAAELFSMTMQKEKTGDARGVLFLIDPGGKQVRLEIGYELEPVFNDGFVGSIEREQMIPFFQTGRIGGGIEATVELLVGKALDRSRDECINENSQCGASSKYFSGGGGAKTTMKIGSDIEAKKIISMNHVIVAQLSPFKTLELYKAVLMQHIKDPDLGIYTPETREFFKKWLVTDGQQNNELQNLEKVLNQGKVFIENGKAVIRFPIENRHAPPYFFRYSNDGWMLDFSAMHKAIGFNHKNQWFFKTLDHIFMFAYDGVSFDAHGFPYVQP